MERREDLFIVRIWTESGAARPDEWRGTVLHVGSGTRKHFSDLSELEAFLARSTSDPIRG
jgi:hypothetical protein